MDREELARGYLAVFGEPEHDLQLFRAPGRVNVIGEHTDYNEGYVLPIAIDRSTSIAVAPQIGRTVRAYSRNTNSLIEIDLDSPPNRRTGQWRDFIEGMCRTLEARGVAVAGANLYISSNVPDGAGLSSSAALEIATGLALLAASQTEMERVELALAAQHAEHEFVGTMCGIMDQFISAMGRANHALLIDCRSLAFQPIPLRLDEHVLVVCDTNVKHELASGEYNKRRSECEHAVAVLREVLPEISSLRDVQPAVLWRHKALLGPIVFKRARHVVSEIERTLQAADAMRTADLVQLGELMNASHDSLRDDFEVSCLELDTIVAAAREVEGTLGSRMTGGGFGGSTISLVAASEVRAFKAHLRSRYEKATGLRPGIWEVQAVEGAGLL